MLSPFSSPLQNRLLSHKGMFRSFVRTCCAVCRLQISGFWFWEDAVMVLFSLFSDRAGSSVEGAVAAHGHNGSVRIVPQESR
jgi:hypothetical protein